MNTVKKRKFFVYVGEKANERYNENSLKKEFVCFRCFLRVFLFVSSTGRIATEKVK